MADDRSEEQRPGTPPAAPDAEAAAEAADAPALRTLWQIPTILISVLLITLGIYVAVERSPEDDFDQALDLVQQYVDAGQYEAAATQLTDVIEPGLDEATRAQEARYHALVGDWLVVWQETKGVATPEYEQRIAGEYSAAAELGFDLDAAQTERWARALVKLDRLEEIHARLAELEAMELHGEASSDARLRRNRVLRKLVEASLKRPDQSIESLMTLLGKYRADDRLSAADEGWAVARQAELRLDANEAQAAVDHLLLDIRRIESRFENAASANFPELYTLLARGYVHLGERDEARYHLDRAMEELKEVDPVRGDALVLMGQIEMSRGELDAAFEHIDQAARLFPGEPCFLPALLGRARARSVLGDHRGSLADFQRLQALLEKATPRRDVTPELVSRALCDRHDACLALGRLPLAVEYIELAEGLSKADAVPPGVLLRIASTHRQLADNLLAEAQPSGEARRVEEVRVSPAVRHEANEHYERAGEYYVRHARRLVASPTRDEQWAESLWLAGDSFDLGGRPDVAIKHFQEYLAGRPASDPRRAGVTFRLAQAYQAQREFESAVQYYEQVIAEHPRSPQASQSHVPMAHCLVELDRTPEAKQLLTQVLTGNRILEPDAVDYRDALIALSGLHYDDGEYARAIERLTEAAQRYPDDARRDEILFRLADSYRSSAAEAKDELERNPTLPPSEQQRLGALRIEHLEMAAELFGSVCEMYRRLDPTQLTAAQNHFRRNAHLYRGQCAYHLGWYEQAIEYFDYAARVFDTDVSSLTALIQIVNCYNALGDTRRAAAAHERAKSRLRQLPEDAFDRPDALMNRQAWEQWLKDNPPTATASASAAGSDMSM